MKQGWIEVWRDGEGDTGRRCTIERTPDAYAVDVFRGDTCIYSMIYPTPDEARAAAEDRRLRRGSLLRDSPIDRCIAHSLAGCAKAQERRANRSPSAAA